MVSRKSRRRIKEPPYIDLFKVLWGEKKLSPKERAEFSANICKNIGLPLADERIRRIVTHPFVLEPYAYQTLNNDWERREMSFEERQAFDKKFFHGHSRINFLESEDVIRMRFFGWEGGRYYAEAFKTTNAAYMFLDTQPVLVTRIARRWKNEFQYTMANWISRLEVKVLASICFSAWSWHAPIYNFQFKSQKFDIPTSLFKSNPFSEDGLREASTAIYLKQLAENSQPIWSRSEERHKREIGHYDYVTVLHGESERIRKLYNAFRVEDEYALRCAYLLLKSASLFNWYSDLYAEEANASLLFALENCLYLIHRKLPDRKNKFEIEPTLKHIESVWPEYPGYLIMLKEAHKLRVDIVHPESNYSIGWMPYLNREDYVNNYGMAMDLFYYALVGEKLPQHETQGAKI